MFLYTEIKETDKFQKVLGNSQLQKEIDLTKNDFGVRFSCNSIE